MRYPEPKDKAGEFLRLAISLMSKHEAPPHPFTYALWYEYASGVNAALKVEIDQLTSQGNKLNDETTRRLYRKHVAELDEETANRINSELQRVMQQVAASAASTGDRAQQFGVRLEQLGGDLDDQGLGALLSNRLTEVLRDTREMQSSISQLNGRLDTSQTEITRLRQELARVREEVMVDALTGLLNRRAFDDRLAALIAQSMDQNRPLSLIMIDIDHFKRINDTYGHLFGDRVIQAVGQTLRANVKGRDTVVRYGGEEFAVLLPETPLNGARSLAEQVRNDIASRSIRRLTTEETVGNITISAGVTMYERNELGVTFIERADKALYQSKQGGRNMVTVAAPPA